MKGIKAYKSMSEDRLLSAIKASESLKEREKNFGSRKPKIKFRRIEKFGKKFNEARYKFFRSKINKIRRNLYEIENPKNLSALKIKEIERSLSELEESLSKTKKYYDNDDKEYE